MATGEKIIQHAIDSRKGIIISAPELKRESSTAWQGIATSLRVKYWTKSLEHFINGVCKENPRYRYEQLQAIEHFLDSKKPIDRDWLEQVFASCCDQYAYRVSEFEVVFSHLETSTHSLVIPMYPLETKMLPSVKIQLRGMESYGRAFRQLAADTQGGRR